MALTGLLMMIAKNIGTELCRAPTPTPTQTRLDSTPPNIGIGVTIVRDWSLDGAEFKTYYTVARQTMLIEFIYIMPLLVNNLVETALI